MERIGSYSELIESGSIRRTVEDPTGHRDEILVLATDDGTVVAWKNFCLHELDQPLDPGDGPVIRDGALVCPRHGSTFDIETGTCDHGPASGSRLVSVEVERDSETIVLTDDHLSLVPEDDDDDDEMPSSTSHLRF